MDYLVRVEESRGVGHDGGGPSACPPDFATSKAPLMQSSPHNGEQSCSMPHCGRLSCFHVRLDAAVSGEHGRDSCGAHLAEVVQQLALRAREHGERPTSVIVYATVDGRRANETGPFDRLALGTIPV
ncbi:hypothetical protein [Actinomadura sp. GTD37]|uniref:hypothetical protein n=1 Tax=Actinomadura sp. GTD37 TaxID=1778030 RepID=UPI0035C1B8E4